MVNTIIYVVATGVIIYGFIDLFFNLTGINKDHRFAMENINISFIRDMKEIQKQAATYGINSHTDSDLVYLVPGWPGIINKLRGRHRLYLFVHTYDVTKPEVDKSCQLLDISKETYFYMQLKGWIETKDRNKAVKAIRHLKEVVSLP